MKRHHYTFLLVCCWLYTGSIEGFAQDANAPASIPEASSPVSSCEQVVPPDSAYGFVRILERDNSKLDIMQVNVDVEFQIAEYEPCSLTKTTPVELHFPRRPFSLEIRRQEGQNQFQFSIHRKRLGPFLFMKDVDQVCLMYDEQWRNSTWC